MKKTLQTRRAVLGGLLALVAAGSHVAAPLAAKPVDEKEYKWVGEHLLCQCGCGSTVYGCNHYGCSEAAELRKAVRDALAHNAVVVAAVGNGEQNGDPDPYPAVYGGVIGVGAITGRAEAQTLRLSLLYALMDASRVIRCEHILAASAIWR